MILRPSRIRLEQLYGKAVIRRPPYVPGGPFPRDPPMTTGYEFFLVLRKAALLGRRSYVNGFFSQAMWSRPAESGPSFNMIQRPGRRS